MNIELTLASAYEKDGSDESIKEAEFILLTWQNKFKFAFPPRTSDLFRVQIMLASFFSNQPDKKEKATSIYLELISQHPESERPSLGLAIHYFRICCQKTINNEDHRCYLELAKMYAIYSIRIKESGSNLSCLAHIDRMMGNPDAANKRWQEAEISRGPWIYSKGEKWRLEEQAALSKLRTTAAAYLP